MIMQERQEREARRAEKEQLERSRAEQEARLLEEQNRQRAERERRAAAGAAGTSAAIPPQAVESATTQRRQQRAEGQSRPAAASSSQAPPAAQASQQRLARVPVPQSAQGYPAIPATSGPPPASAAGGQTGESSGAAGGRPRNSFPHAFERWEALSAHWEGLTSFWIRQLQQRSDEIDRDPLNQQLSRQVTDLSAAGANLFHAVVELQRLRASSERKFQRWFFETRGELERNAEVNAMLEAALDEERRGRADAIRDAVEHDRVNSKTQKQLLEMRKELAISKEEARRAWEELGRREQEERDRTISLQQGLPTIVGGVQVVPMTQGVPSRHGSTREPRTPAEAGPSDYTRTPGGRPTVSAGAPQGPEATYGGGPYGGPGSEGGFSEGEYLIDGHGNFVRDAQGNKIPFRSTTSPGGESDAGAEEYESLAAQQQRHHQPQPGQPAPSYPPSSSHYYPGAPDYQGQGYGPGWETVPRHHHPTRLSDVIEEDDERSRTTASQVSRV